MNEGLGMQMLKLWKDESVESVLRYDAVCAGASSCPAILVVPGGGYTGVCMETEGYPIAEHFRTLGFRTFILTYRVAPHRFPEPQMDILRAIRLIRAHAGEWGVNPRQLAVCGFSAGGHLCASAGTLCDEIDARDEDAADAFSARPDAMILCYPVISGGKYAHKRSFVSLLGKEYSRRKGELSLEKRVTEKTPPAFLWHTAEDQTVPVENSLLFAGALREHHVACELHVFPHGCHGMTLGTGHRDIAQWPGQAKAFLMDTCGFQCL